MALSTIEVPGIAIQISFECHNWNRGNVIL